MIEGPGKSGSYVIELSCPSVTNIAIKDKEKSNKYRNFITRTLDVGQQRSKLTVSIVGCLEGINARFFG